MKIIKNNKYTFVGNDDIMIKVDEHDKIINLGEVFSFFHPNEKYLTKQNFPNGVLFKEALGKIDINKNNKRLYEFIYECNNEYYKRIIKDEVEKLRNELILNNNEEDDSNEIEMKMEEKINMLLREIIRLGHLVEIKDGKAIAVDKNINEYQRRLKAIIEQLYNVSDEAFDKIKLDNIKDPFTNKISLNEVNKSLNLMKNYLNRVNALEMNMNNIFRDFPDFDTINNEILTMIQKFKNWIRNMFGTVNEAAKEINELDNKNIYLQRENEELKISILVLFLVNDNLKKENENTKNKIIDLEKEIKNLNTYVNYLVDIISEKNIEIIEFQKKIKKMNNTIKNLNNVIADLNDENKELHEFNIELNVVINMLNDQIRKLKDKNILKDVEIFWLNDHKTSLMNDINILKENIKSLETKNKKLKEENEELEEENTNLLDENIKLQAETLEYIKYINEITDKVEELTKVLNGQGNLMQILNSVNESIFSDIHETENIKKTNISVLPKTLTRLVVALKNKSHKNMELSNHDSTPIVIHTEKGKSILHSDTIVEIINNVMNDMDTALTAQHLINSFICTINEVYASLSIFGNDKVKTYNSLFSAMHTDSSIPYTMNSDYNRIINNIHFISLYENIKSYMPHSSIKEFYEDFLGEKYTIFILGNDTSHETIEDARNSIITLFIYYISTFDYKSLYNMIKKYENEDDIYKLMKSIESMKDFECFKTLLYDKYSKINISKELKKLYIKQIHDIILNGNYVQLFALNYDKIPDPNAKEDTVMRYNKDDGIDLGKKCIFYIFDYTFLINNYPSVTNVDDTIIPVAANPDSDEDENFVRALYNTIATATYEKFLQLTYPISPNSSFSYSDLNDENEDSKTKEYFKGPCYDVLVANPDDAESHSGAYSSYAEGTAFKHSILSLYQELKRNMIKVKSFYGNYSVAVSDTFTGGSKLKLENKIDIYKSIIKFLLVVLITLVVLVVICSIISIVKKHDSLVSVIT